MAGRTDEQGSLSLELAMLAPVLLLVFGLIVAFGRYAQVEGTMQSGTRDAARSATRARSYAEAVTRANTAMKEALDNPNTPRQCMEGVTVKVDKFVPGEPLTVTTSCTYSIQDAGLPVIPGSLPARSTFTSVVSDYRSVDQ